MTIQGKRVSAEVEGRVWKKTKSGFFLLGKSRGGSFNFGSTQKEGLDLC